MENPSISLSTSLPVNLYRIDGEDSDANGYPLVLQVLGLKRYHDEDTRKNTFSLILSNGNAVATNEVDHVRKIQLFP
jgi:hypothetical protein